MHQIKFLKLTLTNTSMPHKPQKEHIKMLSHNEKGREEKQRNNNLFEGLIVEQIRVYELEQASKLSFERVTRSFSIARFSSTRAIIRDESRGRDNRRLPRPSQVRSGRQGQCTHGGKRVKISSVYCTSSFLLVRRKRPHVISNSFIMEILCILCTYLFIHLGSEQKSYMIQKHTHIRRRNRSTQFLLFL